MDESLGANSVVLPNSRETVKIGSKMEPITAPLSLGNVGIIETDGASFPRAPSFLKRPREEGEETSEGKMRQRRDGRMEGFAREFPATSDRVIIRGVRHGTEKRKSSKPLFDAFTSSFVNDICDRPPLYEISTRRDW